jgi:hypothetical protein
VAGVIWRQTAVALAISIVSAVGAYKWTEHVQMERLAQIYPHDGQIGLGAMMVGLEAGAIIFIAVFLVALLCQRAATARKQN